MQTRILAIALLVAAALLSGCNKKNNSASAQSADPVQQKLQELAGNDAKNCGRVKSPSEGDTKSASDCAVQSAQSKKPFYVAYDMPGLTVAVAGAPDGKLYSVQSQTPAPAEGQNAQTAGQTQVTATPCPSELRVASSGRVTCFPTGSFGVTPGASPHGGGMTMPPAGMTNPHGGSMSMPPPGTPNPHGASGMMTSSHGSATKNEKPAPKDASKQ